MVDDIMLLSDQSLSNEEHHGNKIKVKQEAMVTQHQPPCCQLCRDNLYEAESQTTAEVCVCALCGAHALIDYSYVIAYFSNFVKRSVATSRVPAFAMQCSAVSS